MFRTDDLASDTAPTHPRVTVSMRWRLHASSRLAEYIWLVLFKAAMLLLYLIGVLDVVRYMYTQDGPRILPRSLPDLGLVPKVR